MPNEPTTNLRIGPSAAEVGLSPRMARYLEEQGVLRPDRGPHDRGHRHYPPAELELARVATAALKAGSSIDGLATVRRLADRRVEAAHADADPIAWFELLAIARAADRILHAHAVDRPSPPTHLVPKRPRP